MDWKTVELGHPWSKEDLGRCFKAIFGGIAWPGQRPGFAVVVGLSKEKHFDSYDAYLLDEYESPDTRELVRRCSVLDYKYEPARWIADPDNDAADRFLRELNEERTAKAPQDHGPGWRLIGSVPDPLRLLAPWRSPLFDEPRPYGYILPELKRLLAEDHRQLFLKNSRVRDSLAAVEPNELATLQLGTYPAIEALGFTVVELRDHGRALDNREPDDDDEMQLAASYVTQSAL
jgi:hypothetical protein